VAQEDEERLREMAVGFPPPSGRVTSAAVQLTHRRLREQRRHLELSPGADVVDHQHPCVERRACRLAGPKARAFRCRGCGA
jgi:hypothetical protein